MPVPDVVLAAFVVRAGDPGAGPDGRDRRTASDTKYRADGCKFLAKSTIPCTRAEAKKKGLEPCSVCNPPK